MRKCDTFRAAIDKINELQGWQMNGTEECFGSGELIEKAVVKKYL